MANKHVGVADRVAELAAPIAEQLGLSVWDVFFGKEGQDMILRITIDKQGGIFISDCEALSRAVDPLLDELDIPGDGYRFEVSSPGLGRKLRTDKQLEAYVGKDVAVHLIRADETGGRDFAGTLTAFDCENVTVCVDGTDKTIKRNAVSSIKADDDKDI